ncbi:hypothetical protein QBC44DRAFT_87356 [Cladorrhinum sp. PSN332]|nr:hypothetical protein QBC44DRAFT_87356 [Cladorrhinum sp. PSN332]
MRSQVAAWTASILVALSTALPSVTFPINSQVPPVARIGEPFSFVFSPSTFSSDSPLSYTLDKPPQWLSIESNGRRLFGTPKAEDVGPGEVEGVLVNVVAADKSGSTTHTATLVVSRNKGPKLQVPLEKQAPVLGVFSGPSSILVLPDQPFSFDLKQDTFSNPSSSPLGYYAVMADNTPLPAWVSFDAGKLSFSGRTPPFESLIQPPQRFALMLVASDVVGFSGAELGIDIVVGTHQITTDQTTILLTATPGKPVSYTRLKESVKVDGKPVTADTVVLASTSNLPSWLSVDNGTWHIGGTPPETATSTNFTITLQDSFLDTLNVSVMVDVVSEASKKAGLFKGDMLPTFTATAGKPFSFDLGLYLVNPQDIEISVTTLPLTSWVHFDANKLTLFGDAPEVTKDSVVGVRVEAKSKSTNKSDSLSLLLRLAAVGSDTSGGSSTQPPDSTSTRAGESLAGDGIENRPANLTLMAILLPLSFILLALICALFRCYRRRKENERPRGITVRDISGPLPGTFEIKSSAPGTPPSLPAFDIRNFDKSFTVNDVFVSEKKNAVVEQRRSAPGPGRPTLSPSPASIRMLPSSLRSKHGSGKRGIPRMPFLGDASFGRLASSLSSISETSLNDERGGAATAGNQRAIGLLGRSRGGYFRDAVEIRIPNAPSQSVTPSSQRSETETESSISRTSSGGSQHLDTRPLRTESRLGYHPPSHPSKKFAWSSWLRGKNVKRKMPTLGQRPNNQDNNHGNQSSISTVDTFDYKRHSSRLSSQRGNTASPSTSAPPKMTPIPLPPARLIGKVHLARPVTRKGPATKASVEVIISSGASTNPVTPRGPRPQQSQQLPRSHKPQLSLGGGKKGVSLPVLPNWRDTPDEFLSLSYENLVNESPFHPSTTWSTIPAGSPAGGVAERDDNDGSNDDDDDDHWVDETVESLAPPISIIGGKGQEVNWKVVGPESSPIREEVSITDWDAGTEKEGGTTASSPYKAEEKDASIEGREGKEEEGKGKEKEKAEEAVVDGGSRVCDFARKGHAYKLSKGGKSLLSEASKDESDYAVYI